MLYNYWYIVIATCFGPSLDHLQTNVFICKRYVRTVYCGTQYYLQGVRENNQNYKSFCKD